MFMPLNVQISSVSVGKEADAVDTRETAVLVIEEACVELLLLETCNMTDDPTTVSDRSRLVPELTASILEVTADELDPLAELATLLVNPVGLVLVVR